jgi:phosphatidylinositol 3-kinase
MLLKCTQANVWISFLFIYLLLLSCSPYYTRFKSYCCEAYNIIRKSSNLILNLFHLMAGSNIPDIASDPEKGILKVTLYFSCDYFLTSIFFSFSFLSVLWFSLWWCLQLQEKFRLDMDDEACIHFFQDLINESVSALFPQMVETIHRWAQYWR